MVAGPCGDRVDCSLDARVVVTTGVWLENFDHRNARSVGQTDATSPITCVGKIRNDIACAAGTAFAVKTVLQALAVVFHRNQRRIRLPVDGVRERPLPAACVAQVAGFLRLS
ncbi:hypothetical protein D3C73_1010570 [compost metagenome]